MKHHAHHVYQLRSVICFFMNLICCLWLFIPPPAGGKDSVADEIISIDVKGQPLGEVLEDISEATGYQFSIHESWEDFPVTASFKNEPLHKGLKKILRKLNNAIIYGSDGTIKIMIYGEVSSSETAARPPISERLFEQKIRQPVPQRRPFVPQPSAGVSEQKRDEETDAPSAQEDSESVSESNETGDDKEDQKEDEAERADEEASETSASQEKENASENDADRTEETESSSEESDDSANKKSAKETTTN